MAVEHIQYTDTLRQGTDKINAAINNLQTQLDTIVIEGDSSVEAAQARVDADGNVFTTLKERLDTKETQLIQGIEELQQDIANFLIYNVKSFGAVGDGVTDDTAVIIDVLNNAQDGSTVYFPVGKYKVNAASTIQATKSLKIIFEPGAEIDAKGSTASPIFKFTGSVGTYYLLGASPSAGDRTITVNTTLAASLSEGGLIKITTDSNLGGSGELWNDARAYYYKGEICEVLSVSGTTVTLKSGLADSYTAANTVVAEIDYVEVELNNFTLEGAPANNQIGVEVGYAKNVKIKGGNITGTSYSALELDNCFNVSVDDGYSASNLWYTGGGTNYGLMLATCQNAEVAHCNIVGGRHAIAIGGKEPNRFIDIHDNILDSDSNSVSYALDTHGNSQYIKFHSNTVKHAITVGGIDTEIKNNICIAKGMSYGTHINYRPEGDNVTCNYLDISGNTIYGNKDSILFYIEKIITIDNLKICDNLCLAGIGINIKQTSTKTLTVNQMLISGNEFKGIEGVIINGYNETNKMLFTNINIKDNMFNCIDRPIIIYNASGTTVDISGNNIRTNKLNTHTVEVFTNVAINYILFNDNIVKNVQSAYYPVRLDAVDYIECVKNILDSFQTTGGLNLDATDILIKDNIQINTAGSMSLTGRYFKELFGNNNTITWGTAAPTTGTWTKGDICNNISATASGKIGWVCVTGGTPGTWKAFGAIDA